eukprot:403374890
MQQDTSESTYQSQDIFDTFIQIMSKEMKQTSQNKINSVHLPKLDAWEIWFKDNNNFLTSNIYLQLKNLVYCNKCSYEEIKYEQLPVLKLQITDPKFHIKSYSVLDVIVIDQQQENIIQKYRSIQLLLEPKRYQIIELNQIIKDKIQLQTNQDLILVELDQKTLQIRHLFLTDGKQYTIKLKPNQRLQVFVYIVNSQNSTKLNFINIVNHKDFDGNSKTFENYNDKNTFLPKYKHLNVIINDKPLAQNLRKLYKYLQSQIKNLKNQKPLVQLPTLNLEELLRMNVFDQLLCQCPKCQSFDCFKSRQLTRHPEFIIMKLEKQTYLNQQLQQNIVLSQNPEHNTTSKKSNSSKQKEKSKNYQNQNTQPLDLKSLPIQYNFNFNIYAQNNQTNIEIQTETYQLISVVNQTSLYDLKKFQTYNKNIKRNINRDGGEWYCLGDAMIYPIKFEKIDTSEEQQQQQLQQPYITQQTPIVQFPSIEVNFIQKLCSRTFQFLTEMKQSEDEVVQDAEQQYKLKQSHYNQSMSSYQDKNPQVNGFLALGCHQNQNYGYQPPNQDSNQKRLPAVLMEQNLNIIGDIIQPQFKYYQNLAQKEASPLRIPQQQYKVESAFSDQKIPQQLSRIYENEENIKIQEQNQKSIDIPSRFDEMLNSPSIQEYFRKNSIQDLILRLNQPQQSIEDNQQIQNGLKQVNNPEENLLTEQKEVKIQKNEQAKLPLRKQDKKLVNKGLIKHKKFRNKTFDQHSHQESQVKQGTQLNDNTFITVNDIQKPQIYSQLPCAANQIDQLNYEINDNPYNLIDLQVKKLELVNTIKKPVQKKTLHLNPQKSPIQVYRPQSPPPNDENFQINLQEFSNLHKRDESFVLKPKTGKGKKKKGQKGKKTLRGAPSQYNFLRRKRGNYKPDAPTQVQPQWLFRTLIKNQLLDYFETVKFEIKMTDLLPQIYKSQSEELKQKIRKLSDILKIKVKKHQVYKMKYIKPFLEKCKLDYNIWDEALSSYKKYKCDKSEQETNQSKENNSQNESQESTQNKKLRKARPQCQKVFLMEDSDDNNQRFKVSSFHTLQDKNDKDFVLGKRKTTKDIENLRQSKQKRRKVDLTSQVEVKEEDKETLIKCKEEDSDSKLHKKTVDRYSQIKEEQQSGYCNPKVEILVDQEIKKEDVQEESDSYKSREQDDEDSQTSNTSQQSKQNNNSAADAKQNADAAIVSSSLESKQYELNDEAIKSQDEESAKSSNSNNKELTIKLKYSKKNLKN